jgi:small conductance mechanosensitive channel
MAKSQLHNPLCFWHWNRRSNQRFIGIVLGAIAFCSITVISSPAGWGQSSDNGATPDSAFDSAPTIFGLNQSQIPSVEDFWSPVGNYIRSAPVYLDGRVLFRVAPTESLAAEFRAQDIEQRLNRVDREVEVDNLEVGWEIVGNQPVITVNGENLFTVTARDAELNGIADPTVRAEELSQRIEDALLQYQREREPANLKQQGYLAGGALLLLLGLSIVFGRIQRRIQHRKQRAKQTVAVPIDDLAESTSSQEVVTALRHQVTRQQKLGVLELQRWVCRLAQLLIWGGGIFAILGLFPYTRGLQPLTFSLLEVPFKVTLTILILYGLIRFSNVLIDRIALKLQERAALASMQSQRLALRFSTFSQVLKSISATVLITIGVLSVLSSLGLDLAPLLAGAGIIGLALSLASQNVLKDVINGFLILTEDQYGVGDVIMVEDVAGFVETMNLRITQLRNEEGRLITIPNSRIAIVQNLSKEWSRVDLKIPVAPTADINQALEVINHVAQDMCEDPIWRHLILEPPLLLGVDNLDYIGATVRLWIKTQPLKQWDVAREYRRRLKIAFDQTGINIGVPQQTLHVQSALPIINIRGNGTLGQSSSSDTQRQSHG